MKPHQLLVVSQISGTFDFTSILRNAEKDVKKMKLKWVLTWQLCTQA